MIDPIADMLTRIRNAYLVRKAEVLVPHSKIKFSIAELLEKEHYINRAEVIDNSGNKEIRIILKYNNKESAIRNIKRVSKIGRRIYVGKDRLPRVLNNLGVAIVSTSKGIMTNKEPEKLVLEAS